MAIDLQRQPQEMGGRIEGIVGDGPCPKCRESGGDKTGNHLIEFSDGNKFCNRCKYTEINGKIQESGREEMDIKTVEDVLQLPIFGIPHRQISLEACEHYGIRTEFDSHGEPIAWFYPHTVEGQTTGFKRKGKDKQTWSIGSTRSGDMFGQSVLTRGKLLVITEGEEDACAVWDTLRQRSEYKDWIPSVCSLAHGASAALSDMGRALETIVEYNKVILCFDEDDAGRKAVEQCAPLAPDRIRITHLTEVDANAMVLAGKHDDLKWAIVANAKAYQPDGIINGADTWDRYKKTAQLDCYPYPTGWKIVNEMTYGYRPGSIVTITAGTGVGKTQIMREIKLNVFDTTDWKIADISLEEDIGESVGGLMSLGVEQRLHLPDVEVEEDIEREIHTRLFGSGRWSFYDHFGGMDDTNLFNKLRYFAATGHRAIFLDHLSIIVSEYAAQGGERERIDTVMTKLAKIAKEFEIVIFIIVHLRKEGGGRSFENGATPNLDDLRGSGTLKQLSWDVLALSRDQQHPNFYCRNTTKLTVLKCRFSGSTGEADFLHYDDTTGRMRSVPKPEGYEQEVKRSF